MKDLTRRRFVVDEMIEFRIRSSTISLESSFLELKYLSNRHLSITDESNEIQLAQSITQCSLPVPLQTMHAEYSILLLAKL